MSAGERIEGLQPTPEQTAHFVGDEAKYIAETVECPKCGGHGMVMSWGGPTDCDNGCHHGRVFPETEAVALIKADPTRTELLP
jgi:hypothetical protein